MKFEIESPLPTKKNSYHIKWNPRAFLAVAPILKHFKKPWHWISPTKEVQDMETFIAWIAKRNLPDLGDADLRLTITYRGRNDVDAPAQLIMDAIEKSGRIKNDRQFVELVVKRIKGPRGLTIVEVEKL